MHWVSKASHPIRENLEWAPRTGQLQGKNGVEILGKEDA